MPLPTNRSSSPQLVVERFDGLAKTGLGLSAEVVMPVDSGRDGSPWPPLLRDLEWLLAAWPRFETLDLPHRFGQGEIADRPDIGFLERHQKIDISGPGAYPDDREKLVAGALLVSSSQLR